jgi:hypothetical protein
MKIVMTLMVRDEADIIGPMIEHHLGQGFDTIIVTDNGSIDGTREILETFAAAGRIELHHDPVHRKQQSTTVTGMARRAATEHGADWVVNADADEFWVARSPGRSLADAFATLPSGVETFVVPVHDMTGAPAERGSGLQRLVYRDHRPVERLHQVGLFAHSSPDTVHIGSASVNVVQGNHSVDLASGVALEQSPVEVLHFPWRSWEQYRRKVDNAGRAYEASALSPSPNHHGMRDYRRLREGTLFALYVARHPGEDELADGLRSGDLVEDRRIAAAHAGPIADDLIGDDVVGLVRPLGEAVGRADASDRALALSASTAAHEIKLLEEKVGHLEYRIRELEEDVDSARSERDAARVEMDAMRSRRVVRAADRIAGLRRRSTR